LALLRGADLCAVGESPTVLRARELAVAAYARAETLHRAAPTNTDAAWRFGRACFDWAEVATNDTQRAELAERGIAACREAVAREPKLAPAQYYLGLNLGQLARTKRWGALKIVGELERAFAAARNLDEQFDHAGPDRCLGLLYRDAPGWPISVGSRSRARKHLQRAVTLAPDYPENRLNLLEACIHWNDGGGARRELEALDALWPAARANLGGEKWAMSWTDWEKQLRTTRTKVEATGKPVGSPRDKK
jgi:tetratricopeptide (TPR) repeat protein